jgi:hypothetical protein
MATKLPWYWSERMHQKWHRMRARGIAHFVLVRGVLAWGGSMFVFFVLFWAVFAAPFFGAHIYWPNFILEVGVVFLAAGVLWGISTWRTCERLYRKYAADAP